MNVTEGSWEACIERWISNSRRHIEVHDKDLEEGSMKQAEVIPLEHEFIVRPTHHYSYKAPGGRCDEYYSKRRLGLEASKVFASTRAQRQHRTRVVWSWQHRPLTSINAACSMLRDSPSIRNRWATQHVLNERCHLLCDVTNSVVS